ncbi:molybdopterin-dependent oxidoreductase [Marinibactrum halimedae]|uniref:Oxidoreductase n=1 Tax=Marinibactrum halimedae TaxID=1444977 RepID=A0AA37WLH7_9GAMM|nr:molybdopterin-dependent oxidoreductase [Marinibactrum halimedae]MCD9459626.1 molybdopterin-dependent oxidoreductase [Marinibactrum halimedae]GLS25653.1 oxidoreductase [Marinibactrum halimedae]
MSEIKTHYRTCNICEAMCGIEVKYQGEEVISIKPDKEDPFSRGHICPKAVALQDFYQDPERLKKPLRKKGEGWEEISWVEAFDEIGAKMRQVQTQYGSDSVGIYLGNPNAHNFGNAIFLPQFFKALGSKSRFSSASADQLPHHVAANYMFGAGMAISVPDINRTDFMLIIGGNPVVSNGSMMSGAGMPGRIKDIQKRGGRVVVVDPRRTETAKIASDHYFIRPEKDALFLMAMIHTVIKEGQIKLGHLAEMIDGVEAVVSVAEHFSPETVSEAVGIMASDIRQLALDFANAPSAVCYGRMGVSTQSFGGLCQWLMLVLNILTGNFDREGGAMFPQPAFDLLRTVQPGKPSSYGRFESRVSDLPFFNGEFPIATLADEIETEGEGQIRAMFTIAGNPVLSAPNGDRLDKAFEQLDFMVSVDIYLNETTKHADIILPATTGLEVAHYDVFFNSFAVSNTAKYSSPLFEKKEYQKHDWEILKGLISALTGKPDNGITPQSILDDTLRSGHYKKQGMSLQRLLDNPHGVDLGPLQPCISERLRTGDGRIQLAPDIYLQDIPRLQAAINDDAEIKKQFPFDMISRRLVRNHNTWTHNSYRLIKGKNPVTLQLHSSDAKALGVEAGQTVIVRSATGQVDIEVEINDDIFPGVVSIPQGWGHNHKKTAMSVAAKQPGISINSLTDDRRVDPLTGNAAFNGTPVAIEVVEAEMTTLAI